MNLSTEWEREEDRQMDSRKQTVQTAKSTKANDTKHIFSAVCQWTSQAVRQWLRNPTDRSVSYRVSHPDNMSSVKQPSSQSIHSACQLVRQQVKQPSSPTAHQSNNRHANQPSRQQVKLCTSQPVSQSVIQPGTSFGSTMWTELRIMPISAICESQPANQPACLLYLQKLLHCCFKSNFSLLSPLPFPFSPSWICTSIPPLSMPRSVFLRLIYVISFCQSPAGISFLSSLIFSFTKFVSLAFLTVLLWIMCTGLQNKNCSP